SRQRPSTLVLQSRCQKFRRPGALPSIIMKVQIFDVHDMKKRSHRWIAASQNTVCHFEKFKQSLPTMIVNCGLCMVAERQECEVQSGLHRLTLKLLRQFRALIKRPFKERGANRHRRSRFMVERLISIGSFRWNAFYHPIGAE